MLTIYGPSTRAPGYKPVRQLPGCPGVLYLDRTAPGVVWTRDDACVRCGAPADELLLTVAQVRRGGLWAVPPGTPPLPETAMRPGEEHRCEVALCYDCLWHRQDLLHLLLRCRYRDLPEGACFTRTRTPGGEVLTRLPDGSVHCGLEPLTSETLIPWRYRRVPTPLSNDLVWPLHAWPSRVIVTPVDRYGPALGSEVWVSDSGLGGGDRMRVLRSEVRRVVGLRLVEGGEPVATLEATRWPAEPRPEETVPWSRLWALP